MPELKQEDLTLYQIYIRWHNEKLNLITCRRERHFCSCHLSCQLFSGRGKHGINIRNRTRKKCSQPWRYDFLLYRLWWHLQSFKSCHSNSIAQYSSHLQALCKSLSYHCSNNKALIRPNVLNHYSTIALSCLWLYNFFEGVITCNYSLNLPHF